MQINFVNHIVVAGKRYKKLIPAELEISNNTINLSFGYDKWLVDYVKTFEQARWNPDTKQWSFPMTEHNLIALEYGRGENPYQHLDKEITYQHASKRPLLPHQKEAIEFAYTYKNVLIQLPMGLGKTLTAIELVELLNKEWWLVAPPYTQKTWKYEFYKWQARNLPSLTTTYESLGKYVEALNTPPPIVVFDESIKIKNPHAQRSMVAYDLCKHMRKANDCHIFLLTGAPIPKDFLEWWHPIHCITPGFIKEGTIHSFKRRVAIIETQVGEYGNYPKIVGWNFEEIKKLNKQLSRIVFSRDKKECLNLPDKIFDVIVCPPTQEMLDAKEVLLEQASSALEILETLRELSDGFKYKHTINDKGKKVIEGYDEFVSPKEQVIKDLLDFYGDEELLPWARVVIYAGFRASLEKLERICQEKGWPIAKVQDQTLLTRFNDPTIQRLAVIANPGTIHGLNFTQANALIYYSNSFNRDARIQSLERSDRIGRKEASRIVDIVCLDTDQLVLDKLNSGFSLQEISLQEIRDYER